MDFFVKLFFKNVTPPPHSDRDFLSICSISYWYKQKNGIFPGIGWGQIVTISLTGIPDKYLLLTLKFSFALEVRFALKVQLCP